MKAIETKYRGISFRSRLEARWAIFMDALNVKYQYEPEAYDLGDGVFYTPDFWLPELKKFLEIKPCEPTNEEQDKAMRLCGFSKFPVVMCFGAVEVPEFGSSSDSAWCIFGGGEMDLPFWWCECPHCRTIGLNYSGRTDYIKCRCVKGKDYTHNTPRLIAAYERARSFVFWTPKQK